MQLNEKQQEAVEFMNGQCMVISCPGSGKTRVIVERAKRLLEKGVNPVNILVITFTKAAADEMKSRFEKAYGKCGILFGTIHSLCFRVLRKAYGYTVNNLMKDGEEYEYVREQLAQRVNTEDIDETVKLVVGEISYVKNMELDITQYTSKNIKTDLFKKVFMGYEEYKELRNKIDFDDMIIQCRDCFRSEPEELKFWKNQFQYLMIDEYQDVNSIQVDIFKSLAGQNGNIFCVGDDDQSIYKFRAADVTNLLNFEEVFPDCKKIYMDTNYRSKSRIIKLATNLIGKNNKRFVKDFKANKSETGIVEKDLCKDSADQVNKIISEVKAQKGIGYQNIAVLYRNNYENQSLVMHLIKEKIPFHTSEPVKDIHSSFIFGDICAYYRLSSEQARKGDIQRILNRPGRYLKADYFKGCRGIRDLIPSCQQMESSKQTSAERNVYELIYHIKMLKGSSPAIIMSKMKTVMNYHSWLQNYAEFLNKDPEEFYTVWDFLEEEAADFDSMEDWLAYADTYSKELINQKRNNKKDGVCLSTFHSAKGLEWEQVCIMDVSEEYCPSQKAVTEEELEEERRLFYVAITRAISKLKLYFIGSDNPSPYLKEMGI